VFFNPAAGSLLPALVGDDDLVAANSGIWSAAVLSQVLLAPVAGLLTQGELPAVYLTGGALLPLADTTGLATL
jgi:hypothetical protein